jgi:hypothetical protein
MTNQVIRTGETCATTLESKLRFVTTGFSYVFFTGDSPWKKVALQMTKSRASGYQNGRNLRNDA